MSNVLLLALAAAVTPTLIYLGLIWWSDRYEREPLWLLLVVFLWGAAPAVMLAVLVALVVQQPLEIAVPEIGGSFLQAVVVAPAVEELVKGLAVIAVVVFAAREMDSVLDGIIYGALVGLGFAMTENFLYFLRSALEDSRPVFLALTAMRSVVFGLNHAWYTALVGAVAAFAFLRYRDGRRWLLLAAGLAVAVMAHAIHNLSTVRAVGSPLMIGISVTLNWGGVAIILAIMILAWKREQEWIGRYLTEEVPGTLSPEGLRLAQATPPRGATLLVHLGGKSRQRAQMEGELRHAATRLAVVKRRLSLPSAAPELAQEIEALRRRVRRLDEGLSG